MKRTKKERSTKRNLVWPKYENFLSIHGSHYYITLNFFDIPTSPFSCLLLLLLLFAFSDISCNGTLLFRLVVTIATYLSTFELLCLLHPSYFSQSWQFTASPEVGYILYCGYPRIVNENRSNNIIYQARKA